MHRNCLSDLRHWFKQPQHKPLILRGARQVGKSTLVHIFAEQRKIELVTINLERNPERAEWFDSNDPAEIVATIRLLMNVNLSPSRSILFLDEIQAAPGVLAALRYFYEELPELHVVAAGSLLDFELASPNFSMPVGRISYLHMYPMGFTEFLRAIGEEALANFVECWSVGDALPTPVHEKLMVLLRQCMAVGGMPEAVKAFRDSRDYRRCEIIKQDLMATFGDDFAKYARHQDQELIRQCFRKAPSFIGRKVKYSEINANMGTPRVSRAITQLSMAKIVHKVLRTSSNSLPLAAEENSKFFKLLFLDVGLVATMLNASPKLLQDQLMQVNRGALAEQWVGQELLGSLESYRPPHLHYWAREARSSSAEVDYVIEGARVPVPVEVKAGKSGTLKSLHLFAKEKMVPLIIRLNTDRPSLMKMEQKPNRNRTHTYHLLSLPLYMAGQIRRILSVISNDYQT